MLFKFKIPHGNIRFIKYILFLYGLIFSCGLYGQTTLDYDISAKDSLLLSNFRMDFTTAIKNKDKDKLAALCDFPFYCRPCIDNIENKNTNPITVKVTKELFYKRHYILFFEPAITAEVMKSENNQAGFFHVSFNDNRERNGFWFSYTIIPPSKYGEGRQGMVFLRKKGSRLKITGLDTVP